MSNESKAPAIGADPKPRFFTETEASLLRALVDCLIPADPGGPSATEAGVDVFIDGQMTAPFGAGAWQYLDGPAAPDAPATLGYQLTLTPRELYRAGLAGLAAAARRLHDGTDFERLSAEDREALLTLVEKGDATLGDWPARAFFDQLLANTREGYFADPAYGGNRDMAAWKMIGFPGARADFTDWIDRAGTAYPYGPVSVGGATG